ncbi:MAG: fucose isomerase [Candidatus Omnitrophota bacterium]|jgi:L-fucose isomerase-like protein|nr:MAG: fucose isomerase [Candidatus Omnitrophota bacterium]
MPKATLAVIVGNRDFFPDRLISEGRQDILKLCGEMDIEPIILGENDTKLGAVETWEHAKRCADLFRSQRDRVEGVLVTLPNFGDEKGVAETLKLSGLDVPVLVQAYPDDLDAMSVERRRDAFCGKISVCNNLRQYAIPFSLTDLHTVRPLTDEFRADLEHFIGVCKVVNGVRTARLGAIGARPNAFNTVRYSEKLLQESGVSVSTIDLSEIFGKAHKLADDDAKVKAKLAEIRAYADAGKVPQASMVLMAKLAAAILEWMEALDLDAAAIQCWTSLQQNYGVNACALMSIMSEKLMPSACEVDVTGALSMYALQLASNQPSALADWNNNYGDDYDKCILFHCGNWAKCFLPDGRIQPADILAVTLGEQCTHGAIAGRTPAGPVTFARISTDDAMGMIRAYVCEGEFTDDPLDTFGSRAVVEIPGLQELMQYICMNGFEHHVAMNASQTADILAEAFSHYLDWEVYYHE